MGFCGDGAGLNYYQGLFHQKLVNHQQREEKDPWITTDSSLTRTDVHFQVRLGCNTVTSTMYDIAVPGWSGGRNTLHLFDLDTVDDSLIESGISFSKNDIEHSIKDALPTKTFAVQK